MVLLTKDVSTNIDLSSLFTLGNIADVLSILGFLLTIWLLIKSEALRKEIDSQRTDYKKEQRSIRTNLNALRNNIRDDNLMDLRIISEVRTHIFTFQQKFSRLLTRKDKSHIRKTLELIDKKHIDSIDKFELCAELDYLVARFDKKEMK